MNSNTIIFNKNPMDYEVPNSDRILIDDKPDVTEQKVQKLIQEWYDAASNPISTIEKIKVFKKISLLNETLKNAKETNTEWGNKVANLINKNINEHTKEESDQLAGWISQNTGSYELREDSQGQQIYVHGAIKFFETLFCKIANNYPHTNESLENFEEILCKAVNFISKNKLNPSLLGNKLSEILSTLPLKDLLEFQKSSKEGYEYACYELARRLNIDLKLSDIVTLDEGCENKIKFFLGDYCSKISKLDFQGKTRANILKTDKSYLEFTKLFKNLKDISLQYYQDVDLSLLESCETVSLSLTTCKLKNFDIKKFSQLKKIDFYGCHNESFNISHPCPNIVTVNFSYCNLQNLNYLEFFPNLKKFSITNLPKLSNEELDVFKFCPKIKDLELICCSQLTDFSFFQHLTKLENLTLTSAKQLTDADLIKIINFCPNLNTIRLLGCTLISENLVNKFRKQGIKIFGAKGRWGEQGGLKLGQCHSFHKA